MTVSNVTDRMPAADDDVQRRVYEILAADAAGEEAPSDLLVRIDSEAQAA